MSLNTDDYISKKGMHCPNCEEVGGLGSFGVIFDAYQGGALQEMYCYLCDSEWSDVYKLTGYENLTIADK